MENSFQVDQAKIAESITILTQLYNTPSEKLYTKARDLVLMSAVAKAVDPIRADRVKVDNAPFYKTGVEWLDFWLGGGIRRKEFVLFGDVPGGGKTHLMAWFASQFVPNGATVAHFFGEDLIEDVQAYYYKAVGKKLLSNIWLVDMQDYSFTAQGMEDSYNKLKRDKHAPDIIVTDHMDIMNAVSQAKADWQEAADVARDLKILAKRTDTIGISASQAHEKGKEHGKGIGRFYRAKIGKSANADLILLVDSAFGDEDSGEFEYHMSRIKARGRRPKGNPKERILKAQWDEMQIEDVT